MDFSLSFQSIKDHAREQHDAGRLPPAHRPWVLARECCEHTVTYPGSQQAVIHLVPLPRNAWLTPLTSYAHERSRPSVANTCLGDTARDMSDMM